MPCYCDAWRHHTVSLAVFDAGSSRISTAALSLSAVANQNRNPQMSCVECHKDRSLYCSCYIQQTYCGLSRSTICVPHLYADDTQIYGSCHPTDAAQLQLQMSACIDDVATWMCSNRLQLNTAKTEVIWCSSSRRQHQLPQTALRVGNNSVMPSTSVRDIGIYIDSDASVRTYVSKTVSTCFAVLRQIRSIQGGAIKMGPPTILSHCKYSENSMNELHGNW